ncbi:MAG TPA: M43 family zinc metalloprotease [Longimicrobiales bacterium]|nr:M43 family zinc metalloprotease [Longimicrobiales bacterium]
MRRALATAAGVLLPMLGSVGAGHAQPQPTYTLRLQVIPLSDDDGGRGNTVTRNQFAGLVADANTAFAPTGIQFVWDSIVGWTPRQSTALNSMANGAGSWWVGPNQVAAQHPGRIVIFLRFGGTDSTAATNAFAYPPNTGAPVPPSAPLPTDDVNFIAFYNQSGFIPGNRSTFVHELGHYVGLFHTFPGWSDNLTDTQQKAASYMQANGGASALDGDGLAETAAEAGTAYYFNNVGNCGGPASYTISGQTFTPDRQNVMSYFGPCQPPWIFTPQQIARMRSTLQHPLRSALLQPPAPMVSAKDQPPPKATMPKAPPPRPPIPRPGTGRPVQPDPTARAVDPSLTEISLETGPIRIEVGGTVELRATGDEMRWVRVDARGAIERVFPADSRLLQNALGDLMIVTAGGEERLGRARPLRIRPPQR